MPEESTQTVAEPVVSSSAAPIAEAAPTTEVAAAPAPDVYETEIGLLDESPAVEANLAKIAETVQPAPQNQFTGLTEGEKQLLSRAGLPEAFIEGWDRPKLDNFTAYLAKSQADQDRLGAELGRLKGAQPEKPKEEAKAEPAKPSPRTERIAQAKKDLIEKYDEDVAPIFDLINEIEADNAGLKQAIQEHGQNVPAMTELVQDLVLDMAFSGLEKDYPSITKPEVRKQVEERFWLEWNTGAYSKPGTPLRQQLASALGSAAKVSFLTHTESSAAASLVNGNKAKLQSQPKIGPQSARPKPRTTDDVYNESFAETMGAER